MAYAVIRKRKRLANPGQRRRKMSRKQIAIFGTKRQKAALKRRRHNSSGIRAYEKRSGHKFPRKLRRALAGGNARKAEYYADRSDWRAGVPKFRSNPRRRRSKRKKNVGSILVASIPGFNPGRKRRKHKSMARRRRRHNPRRRATTHRRRHYSRRRRNPGMRTRTVIKYRTRGRRHHRGGRRRNPGMGGFGGDVSTVLGVVAGATVNSFAMGFVPASFSTGVPGYIASAVIAVLQGQIVGKALKKPAFGKSMTIGGLTYTAIKVINDFFPTLSLGLHGLGAIAPTAGFFSPQVNRWGSMGLFQTPGTVLNAVAMAGGSKGVHGLGSSNFSARRVGRIQ